MTAGFTFNGENPATDYKTGTEFHVDWALMQHVLKTFAFGIAGYRYQQITGDSEPAHASAASRARPPVSVPTSPTRSCAARRRSAPS